MMRHCDIQLSASQARGHTFCGVGRKSQREHWLALCFNPHVFAQKLAAFGVNFSEFTDENLFDIKQ